MMGLPGRPLRRKPWAPRGFAGHSGAGDGGCGGAGPRRRWNESESECALAHWQARRSTERAR